MLIPFAAENVLAQLTDQLTRRKAQLQDAGDKLALIQQAIDDQVQCFPDIQQHAYDKSILYQQLGHVYQLLIKIIWWHTCSSRRLDYRD